MNGSHCKYMLLGGAALFGVLLAVGVPLQSALLFAVVLACPLMMVFMMGGHGGHGADTNEHRTAAGRQGERRDDRDSGAGRGGHPH